MTDTAAQPVGYSECPGACVLTGEEHPGSYHVASSFQTQPASLKVPAVSCHAASVGARCSAQCLLWLFVPSKGQDGSLSLSSVLGCWDFFVILEMKCKIWALVLV